ncbi:MAG: ParB/RepB/Spo0J family partition protein, partial [Methylococcaceae bacterium]|nr:ParB/RepB/Spo0J family partition protein [Methylococcaceae bacterium]
GLGRGLDALLGHARMETAVTAADKLRTLPIEYLKTGRFQPRKDFDLASLQELADSISGQGIVQPIVVRPIGENRYEIVAGERRWRAAQLARLQEIPVVIRDIGDQEALAVALIENIQREDLTPLEEAEALRRLQEEFSLTHQQIADTIGKSRATITNLLRLNELHPEAKALLQQGRIEMGHARALLALDGERQAEIGHQVAAKKLTVRDTEALIRKLLEPGKPKSMLRDPDIVRLEERVTLSLGAKAKIQHGDKGSGKLIISYDTLDQLEGVLQRLG